MEDADSTTDERDVEADISLDRDMETIELEVPVSDVHAGVIEELRAAGVHVEDELAKRLQGNVENTLHQMYQQGRYSQQ